MAKPAFLRVIGALDMRGLDVLHHGLYRAVDGFLSVSEMPRGERAEHLLDDEINRLYERADAIVEEATRRVATSRHTFTRDEWEDCTRLRFRQAERIGGLTDLAAALAREGFPPSVDMGDAA